MTADNVIRAIEFAWPTALNGSDFFLILNNDGSFSITNWNESSFGPKPTASAIQQIIDSAAFNSFMLNERRAEMVCTPAQARLALKTAGLLDAVEQWMGTASDDMRIEWEFSNDVHRSHPAINHAAAALGLSDEQVDALFETAMSL